MNFRLVKQIRENDPLRENFFRLAKQVFGLNFRDWYRKGFWTDQYIPYVMTDGERVAANVSVNIMNLTIRLFSTSILNLVLPERQNTSILGA